MVAVEEVAEAVVVVKLRATVAHFASEMFFSSSINAFFRCQQQELIILLPFTMRHYRAYPCPLAPLTNLLSYVEPRTRTASWTV